MLSSGGSTTPARLSQNMKDHAIRCIGCWLRSKTSSMRQKLRQGTVRYFFENVSVLLSSITETSDLCSLLLIECGMSRLGVDPSVVRVVPEERLLWESDLKRGDFFFLNDNRAPWTSWQILKSLIGIKVTLPPKLYRVDDRIGSRVYFSWVRNPKHTATLPETIHSPARTAPQQ